MYSLLSSKPYIDITLNKIGLIKTICKTELTIYTNKIFLKQLGLVRIISASVAQW